MDITRKLDQNSDPGIWSSSWARIKSNSLIWFLVVLIA